MKTFFTRIKKTGIATVIGFVFFFLAGAFFLTTGSREARAQVIVSAPDVVSSQTGIAAKNTAADLADKVLNKLSATFFKNVLGGLANSFAKQTAQWVVNGSSGKPQFITNFNDYIKGYADALIGDLVSSIVKDITGIDLCSFDPRLALDISLAIPFFPDTGQEGAFETNCSWSDLTDHWEEIGSGKFISASLTLKAGEFPEAADSLERQITSDQSFQLFPSQTWARRYLGTGAGTYGVFGGSLVASTVPPFKDVLDRHAKGTNRIRDLIARELDNLILENNSGGNVTKEDLRRRRDELIDQEIQPLREEIKTILIDPLQQCQGKEYTDFKAGCSFVAQNLGMLPQDSATQTDDEKKQFAALLNDKIKLALQYAQTLNTIYDKLEQTVVDTMREDLLRSETPFSFKDASSIFNPESSEFNVYDKIATEIINEGFGEYINRSVQAVANSGWSAVTDAISEGIKTPANLLSDYSSNIFGKNSVADQFTGQIVADAAGVFTAELWNSFMAKMLLSLSDGARSSQFNAQSALADCQQLIANNNGDIPPQCESLLEQQGINASALEASIGERIGQGQAVADAIRNAIFEASQGAGVLDRSAFEQVVVSDKAVRERIDAIGQLYQSSTTASDLDLFTEFQSEITGEIAPNLYNNVIDSDFALAINSNLTIQQAIEEGKFVGSNKFSFGEKATPGTYHIANIKKLRKARVLPLGFELAAQLVQDCTYRRDLGYADFRDITPAETFGGGGVTNTRDKIILRRCVFQPLQSGLDEGSVQAFNASKLDEIINASVADVVNGYSRYGSGICGDFDADESPFCNLVNPEWVLKLPLSKCFEISADVPEYGEIIQDGRTGIRYTRCVNIASCLKDDGRGSCIDEQYGYCVKESNAWNFSAPVCDPQFNSCKSYQQTGTLEAVAYLQNTLSGDTLCGPQNAGCAWYSTEQVDGVWKDFGQYLDAASCTFFGGTWLGDRCENSRIYFNHFVESCDESQEGCTGFVRAKEPGNNLIADSSFEYTDAGAFPAVWSIALKSKVAGAGNCTDGRFYATCENYRYTDQGICEVNGGTWAGSCSNASITTQFECEQGGNTWAFACAGAVNTFVDAAGCTSGGGVYTNYCVQDLARTQLCENPQFDDRTSCQHYDGAYDSISNACSVTPASPFWSECSVDADVFQPYACTQCRDSGGTWTAKCSLGVEVDSATCTSLGGVWEEACSGARIFDITQSQCESVRGTWRGDGPFGIYGYCQNAGVAGIAACESAGGTWDVTTSVCLAPTLNNQTACETAGSNMTWIEYPIAQVVGGGQNTQNGLSQLKIDTKGISAQQELQLTYTISSAAEGQQFTTGGESYSAAAYLRSDTAAQATLNLYKLNQGGQLEMNSKAIAVGTAWNRSNLTVATTTNGTDLNFQIDIPGGQQNKVFYIDSTALGYNSIANAVAGIFDAPARSYEANPQVYYKKPPEYLGCNGYDVNNPPPQLPFDSKVSCEAQGGFWDQPASAGQTPVFQRGTRCYAAGPDAPACADYAPVCLPEEVGCELYKPANGDPDVPAVTSIQDYCPAACVGYATFKQEPNIFEPLPSPLFSNFIPETGRSCSISEVGCSEFTNLEAATAGGERVQYFSYLRQCIQPNRGLGEKSYFSWRGSASGTPQLITYLLQQDDATGAPATIDGEGDCRLTLGVQDLNCIQFFDDVGNTYYRNIKKTISVSEDCISFRKTRTISDATQAQENCTDTNGTWQDDACVYTVIPSEGVSCQQQFVGCTEYTGNRGNNIANVLFDTFEDTASLYANWASGTEGLSSGNLSNVSESVVLGGHSLLVPQGTQSISKPVSIAQDASYTLSFWARTDSTSADSLAISFSGAVDDGNAVTRERFATESDQEVRVTNEWQQFTVGPVYISWDSVFNNRLIISGIEQPLYLDNILLRRVSDSIFVVKNSWLTPASCDQNAFGLPQQGAMLGCQQYTDTNDQVNYLKSFTNLCRERSIGCEAVIDTKNSSSPYAHTYNTGNVSILDDYTVAADTIIALVLDPAKACQERFKGCQLFGEAQFAGVDTTTYKNVRLINNPDKYEGMPNAIMCSDETLGCTELVNSTGGSEYYKIETTKLCEYSVSVNGWVKKGAKDLGCNALPASSVTSCAAINGIWTTAFGGGQGQCSVVLKDAISEDACGQAGGSWEAVESGVFKCVANPFGVYTKNDEHYDGWVGQCGTQYNGCTEFVDVNPNFIFNGDFENTNASTGQLTSWTAQNSNAGKQTVDQDRVKFGAKAIRLIKSTDRDAPQTPIVNPAQPYSIGQQAPRLEAGGVYEVTFNYYSGNDTTGIGLDCPIPEASFDFNLYQGGTRITDNPIVAYEGKDGWVQASALFEIPDTLGDSLLNYKINLYGPQNGVCLTPESQSSCADFGIYKDGQCHRYQLSGSGALILNKTQCEGLGGRWAGNCSQSFVVYDRVQIKPATEDAYYVIDSGQNIDRTTCSAIDWNQGCIQFTNSSTGKDEILKVDRDRQCSEWLECTETYGSADGYCVDGAKSTNTACDAAGLDWLDYHKLCVDAGVTTKSSCSDLGASCSDPTKSTRTTCEYQCTGQPGIITKSECFAASGTWEPTGNTWSDYSWYSLEGTCKDVDVCVRREKGECVQFASKKDNVRYDVAGDPNVIGRIDVDKAGQQTGYIYRFGISRVDQLTQWRAGDYSGYTIPDRYPIEADIAFARFPTDTQTNRYQNLMCKIFPEELSPLPYQLTGTNTFQNLTNTYAIDDSNQLDRIGNQCSYTVASVQGGAYAYALSSVSAGDGVCARPSDKAGQKCSSYAECTGGTEITLPSGTTIVDDGSCVKVEKVQDFYGIEGLCLESDMLHALYGKIYQDPKNFSNGLPYSLQPYACLTFYPFEVDWDQIGSAAGVVDGIFNASDIAP